MESTAHCRLGRIPNLNLRYSDCGILRRFRSDDGRTRERLPVYGLPIARHSVGAGNFFLFGLTAEEVEKRRHHYDPAAVIAADEELARVVRLLESGHFNQFEPGIFDPIVQSILSPHDPWLTVADFRSYLEAQKLAAAAYRDAEGWTRMSIRNTACSGRFSTDRTMCEYNAEIWHLTQVPAKPVG